jgi:hypothetical protein
VGGALAAGAAVAPIPLLTPGASAQSSTSTATPTSTASTAAATTTTTAPPRAIAEAPADKPLAVFARGICFAAAEVYRRVLTGDKPVRDEIAPPLSEFQLQLVDSATAWSGIGGLTPDTTPDERFVDVVRLDIVTASDESARLRVLHQVEQTLVATMLEVLGEVRSTDAATLAAGIVGSSARRSTVIAGFLDLPLSQAIPDVESTDDAVEVPA